MTDYHQMWGPVQNQWQTVSYRGNEILNVLIIGAWSGLILFFIFGALTLLTQADSALIAMLFSLGVWLACGIAAIRIRRGRKRFLRVQP